MLFGDELQVKGNFVQVKGNFVQVKGNLLQVKGNLLQVKGNLLQVKGNLLQENIILTCNNEFSVDNLKNISLYILKMLDFLSRG